MKRLEVQTFRLGRASKKKKINGMKNTGIGWRPDRYRLRERKIAGGTL